MKLFIFIVLFSLLYWTLAPKYVKSDEWDEFCKVWMKYVNKHPQALHAGCCNIDHPTNDLLKEVYLGEPMLMCDGEYIYG